jgi:hypothetical protein
MKPQFSEAIRELIIKARIVSFDGWKSTHPVDILNILQAADDARLYLTEAELIQIELRSPQTSDLIPLVRVLTAQTTDIIDEARASVLLQFPTITEPGGGLYPPERAEACWRDFWQFLRCITYGIVGGNSQYTSEEGLNYMRLLYRELTVPLDAMIVGIEGLKIASLRRIDPDLEPAISPYFDHLINKLGAFKNV